jgi:outer membrane protein TolC
MKKYKLNFLFILISTLISAQETLTLQQAIGLALQNNYSINISRNETEITKNNVSKGNAGMLPEINLNAGGSFSGNDTKQEFVTGNNVDKKNAQSNNINSGIELNWLVFDGLKMFISYDKLKELNRMNEFATKMQIENTIAEVINTYYDVVRQKQLLKFNESLISIYDERLRVAKTRWEVGKSAKTDFLQAQLDLNLQKTSRIKLKATLTELKTKLNQTLARQADTDFDVTDIIDIDKNIKLEELGSAAMKMNTSLLFYQSNISVNEFSLKEYQSERYPNVSFNANYNFSKTNNQAGFLLYNQNLGWNVGLSASWNLFNGYNTSRNIKNAKISLKNAQLQLDNIKTEIQSSLYKSFRNYQASLEALALEEENANLAKENMDILFESYKLGKANTLEFKEAQRSYEDALSNLFQTRYDAKLAETELLKLKGELVR